MHTKKEISGCNSFHLLLKDNDSNNILKGSGSYADSFYKEADSNEAHNNSGHTNYASISKLIKEIRAKDEIINDLKTAILYYAKRVTIVIVACKALLMRLR